MRKKYQIRRIKTKRSYTAEEIAQTLNVHIQTVREWRHLGLTPIEGSTSPFLFMGSDIREYLTNKLRKLTVKLKDGEFYCLSCKKAVKPNHFRSVNRGITIGKDRQSILLKAECPHCHKTLNRFRSKAENEPLTVAKPQEKSQGDQTTIFSLIEEESG